MFRVTGTLQWIVLLGIGLRILYFLATPYDVRGQDTGSHIEYIEHVAETLSIPNAADGWEFHQAPLYYFLSGRWYRFASEAFAPSKESLLYQIQLGSLIVSIATFLIAIWLGSVLFAAINERRHRNLFALSIAIFPALIFVGARITNNGLYNLLLFLALGLLVRYYKSGSLEDWYSAVLMLSVTIITRISGLLMLPVALACFVLQKNTPKKRLHFMSALLIGAILTGWYPYVRLFVEDDARNTISIGNQNMNGALRVDNTIVNFTTFNPIEILKVPFNDPWKDEARRMYFWEYFFKSALYGEIRFAEELKGIAIFMNLLALILTLAIIRGIVIAFRRRPPELVPMGLTLAFAMTAHFWYRITKAFAANQDFRFSIILIIPLTYFLVIGITSLPERPSKFFELTLKQFAFLTTGFFLLLFLL